MCIWSKPAPVSTSRLDVVNKLESGRYGKGDHASSPQLSVSPPELHSAIKVDSLHFIANKAYFRQQWKLHILSTPAAGKRG